MSSKEPAARVEYASRPYVILSVAEPSFFKANPPTPQEAAPGTRPERGFRPAGADPGFPAPLSGGGVTPAPAGAFRKGPGPIHEDATVHLGAGRVREANPYSDLQRDDRR